MVNECLTTKSYIARSVVSPAVGPVKNGGRYDRDFEARLVVWAVRRRFCGRNDCNRTGDNHNRRRCFPGYERSAGRIARLAAQ